MATRHTLQMKVTTLITLVLCSILFGLAAGWFAAMHGL